MLDAKRSNSPASFGRAKIGIMGVPISSGNRGVQALAASLVNLCAEAAQDVETVLLIGNRGRRAALYRVKGAPREIEVVNLRLSPRSSPREHLAWILLASVAYRAIPIGSFRRAVANSTPWIRALVDAEFVGDIHGGDSFSDIYGLKGLTLTFAMDWTVLLVKGRMVQFPQTYGPYKSWLARFYARFLLKRSSVIIARDLRSQKVASELVPNREILLSPDVAFSLEAIRPTVVELDPVWQGPVPEKIIGINVNGLMYNGGYTGKNMFGLKLDYAAFLPELVTALLRESPGEIWLVPHTFAPDDDVESDPAASRKLRDFLPVELRQRVRIVNRDYDQYEIKGVIGQCDFFVGSRMHACIAALSQGVPCVGVAYSMKFAGVFESVGMESWVVDGRDTATTEAVARIVQHYRERDSVRDGLRLRAQAARTKLREVFASLVAESSQEISGRG